MAQGAPGALPSAQPQVWVTHNQKIPMWENMAGQISTGSGADPTLPEPLQTATNPVEASRIDAWVRSQQIQRSGKGTGLTTGSGAATVAPGPAATYGSFQGPNDNRGIPVAPGGIPWTGQRLGGTVNSDGIVGALTVLGRGGRAR